MRQQLIQYVTLLFAGASDCEDIKQEILQNTLDRYDDLVSQGKSAEAAYRLAISGIGDISELLGSVPVSNASQASFDNSQGSNMSKYLRAIAIGLYILSPIPLFVLSELYMETIGLCGTLVFVAIATVLLVLCKKKSIPDSSPQVVNTPSFGQNQLQKSVNSLIWVIGLVCYFIISFSTNAWFITWIIFPLTGAVQGLVRACFDAKESV